VKNAPAYNNAVLITTVKSFISLGAGVCANIILPMRNKQIPLKMPSPLHPSLIFVVKVSNLPLE
jgi:hypothetical protein